MIGFEDDVKIDKFGIIGKIDDLKMLKKNYREENLSKVQKGV